MLGVVTEGGPQSSDQDARICSYGRLGVALEAREMTQKIVVEDTVTQLQRRCCQKHTRR